MTRPKRNPTESYEDENGTMRNWRPVPDPTELTTQQLMREMGALKEIMQTRMDGYDKAIALLQRFADRQPTIAEVVASTSEKFGAVQLQLHERDIRFDRAATDTRLAVDAAFAAAKEAVAKSEGAVTKQIDQILAQMTTGMRSLDEKINGSIKTVDDKINDVRERLTAMEGRGTGASNVIGYIATAAMVIGAIIGAVMAVFFRGP